MKKVIPEGMRDLTIDESKRRNEIISIIRDIFGRWGYEEIVTPTIEYFDSFNIKTKTLKEEEMYKFFDNRGSILVLRPDMTVPVARMISSKLKDMKVPIKLSYCANIFRVHEMLMGGRNEYLDCGVELVGVKDELSDLEILVTAIETLKKLTCRDFKVYIGYVNILKVAMEEMALEEKDKEKIADLIENKSLINLQEYVSNLNIKDKEKEFLVTLPTLFGEKEVLKKIKTLVENEKVLKNILYLENIYNDLVDLGYENNISIDMAMVPRLNYYTGIIFRGYIDGIGRNILRGGRYDGLLKSFGRDLPAVGFSISVDLLIDSYEYTKENEKKDIILLSEGSKVKEIKKAIEKTRNGESIEFIYKEDK